MLVTEGSSSTTLSFVGQMWNAAPGGSEAAQCFGALGPISRISIGQT